MNQAFLMLLFVEVIKGAVIRVKQPELKVPIQTPVKVQANPE